MLVMQVSLVVLIVILYEGISCLFVLSLIEFKEEQSCY